MNDLQTKISPMLFYEEEVFDSEDYIYELKFDGARCLAYLYTDKTVLINKRFKDVSITYPELSNLHQYIKSPCILDGELVVMDQGKPSFYKLQKRALLVDSFKIKLASSKTPVTFIAYDILYCEDKLLLDEVLIERKRILSKNIQESQNLVISRYIETRGKDFFKLAKQEDLEGIVAKEKNSKYYPGKRSRVWLKSKVYEEDDLVICGYVPNEYGIKDIIFGAYDDNKNLYRAATIMTSKDKTLIMKYADKNPSEPLFEVSHEEVIWMKPYLVGTVKYMMKTPSGGLRQAVFKGLRDDKIASDLIPVK